MENQFQTDTQPIAPITQAAPVAPINPPQTNWYKILFFGLLVLVLVAGGVFAGTKIGNKQVAENPQEEPKEIAVKPTIAPTPAVVSPTTSPIKPSPTTNLTANWKTYTESRELKFSIQYPSGWIINTKDGQTGNKQATFDSDKAAIGSVSIYWQSQPVEPNCNTGKEEKVMVQVKGKKIEMCHSPGSTQEPEFYAYNSSKDGIDYSIVTSNYPGDEKRNAVLKVLSTLEL